MLNALHALALSVVLVLGSLPASAAISLSNFTSSDKTTFLVLTGTFEFTDDEASIVNAARAFDPNYVIFNSPGGNIDAAMRFGRKIRALGLRTLQIRSLECASACALAFMGGVERLAEASSIGVHQSSFPVGMGGTSNQAISDVQTSTANIISYLSEMGIDPKLLQLSLSIDSTDIRYLTAAEMREFHVTTGSDQGANATAPQIAAIPSPQIAPPEPAVSSLQTSSKPNRIAIFTGLDYLGRDLAMVSAKDAASCAMECMSNQSCHAFTFNTATRPGRGPNCFLKDSQGQLDGNADAVSGSLLQRFDSDPQTLRFGVIDPTRNLYEDMDLPGNDLSRRPDVSATTPLDCRLACVNNGQCAAFTFVKTKRECWLKNGVGQARRMLNAVSGTKVPMTYSPRIVDLQ